MAGGKGGARNWKGEERERVIDQLLSSSDLAREELRRPVSLGLQLLPLLGSIRQLVALYTHAQKRSSPQPVRRFPTEHRKETKKSDRTVRGETTELQPALSKGRKRSPGATTTTKDRPCIDPSPFSTGSLSLSLLVVEWKICNRPRRRRWEEGGRKRNEGPLCDTTQNPSLLPINNGIDHDQNYSWPSMARRLFLSAILLFFS